MLSLKHDAQAQREQRSHRNRAETGSVRYRGTDRTSRRRCRWELRVGCTRPTRARVPCSVGRESHAAICGSHHIPKHIVSDGRRRAARSRAGRGGSCGARTTVATVNATMHVAYSLLLKQYCTYSVKSMCVGTYRYKRVKLVQNR